MKWGLADKDHRSLGFINLWFQPICLLYFLVHLQVTKHWHTLLTLWTVNYINVYKPFLPH